MAGNTFQDLFQGQMDFIFFFKGLAFFLVVAVSFLFRRDPSQRLPWLWLGLFALTQGIAAWVSLVAMNFAKSPYIFTGSDVLQILSWVFLAEFGRSGISRIQNRDSGLWLIALLLMLTGLGGLKGWGGIQLISRYSLGLVGGLWAAAALFFEGRNFPPRERGGSLTAGVSLVLYALSIAFFPPFNLAAPGATLSQEAFFKLSGIPLDFIQALLAFGMAAGIYGFLSWRRKAEETQETRFRSRYMFALLTTLAIILGLGSVLTLYLGDWANKRHEKVKAEAQEFANIVVGRLNTEFKRMEDGVISLAETSWLPMAMMGMDNDDQGRINALLDRYRENLNASVVYIMDGNGVTIASSNRAAPDSFVGKNYGFRPYFKQAVNGKVGRYFATGVTSKVPGYYVSYPIRDPRRKYFKAVAVVKVTLNTIADELVAAGQKGNSIIALADPRGVVFLSSQPDMIFNSLWPVADKDLADLKDQYGKDQYAPIFPGKIGDGSKVEYKARNFLGSFAGTIHAGWSVFFFRPIELVGAYRLTGIAVACLLALIALAILGTNFYLKESTVASAGRFRAMFDAAPEAIGVIDPETLQFVEANRSLTSHLGYSQKELLGLRLDRLISQKPQEIQDQLGLIKQEGEAVKLGWRARKKDGSLIDLEVIGSLLEHEGKDQILIFCREAETAPQAAPTVFREREPAAPPKAAEVSRGLATGMVDDLAALAKDLSSKGLKPRPEGQRPPDYASQFDQEAKKLIKRIEEAMIKVEKIRKTSNNRPEA
ncbi:MAG: cache domain-containing protein [Desulfobaccales bacterium]